MRLEHLKGGIAAVPLPLGEQDFSHPPGFWPKIVQPCLFNCRHAFKYRGRLFKATLWKKHLSNQTQTGVASQNVFGTIHSFLRGDDVMKSRFRFFHQALPCLGGRDQTEAPESGGAFRPGILLGLPITPVEKLECAIVVPESETAHAQLIYASPNNVARGAYIILQFLENLFELRFGLIRWQTSYPYEQSRGPGDERVLMVFTQNASPYARGFVKKFFGIVWPALKVAQISEFEEGFSRASIVFSQLRPSEFNGLEKIGFCHGQFGKSQIGVAQGNSD